MTLCVKFYTQFCSKFHALSSEKFVGLILQLRKKNDKYQVVWVWQTSAKYLGLYIECNPRIIYFSNSAFGCWWLWGGSAWCPRPWLGTWKRWSRNPDVWTWSWWPAGGSGEPLLLLLALPIIVSLPPSLSHCIPPLFVGITPLPCPTAPPALSGPTYFSGNVSPSHLDLVVTSQNHFLHPYQVLLIQLCPEVEKEPSVQYFESLVWG